MTKLGQRTGLEIQRKQHKMSLNGDQSSKPDRRKLPQAQFLFINQSSDRLINHKAVHYISPNMQKKWKTKQVNRLCMRRTYLQDRCKASELSKSRFSTRIKTTSCNRNMARKIKIPHLIISGVYKICPSRGEGGIAGRYHLGGEFIKRGNREGINSKKKERRKTTAKFIKRWKERR